MKKKQIDTGIITLKNNFKKNIKKSLMLISLISMLFASCSSNKHALEPLQQSEQIEIAGETEDMVVNYVGEGVVSVTLGKGGKYSNSNWITMGVGAGLTMFGAMFMGAKGCGDGYTKDGNMCKKYVTDSSYGPYGSYSSGGHYEYIGDTYTGSDSSKGMNAFGVFLLTTGLITTIAGAFPHNNGDVYLEVSVISKLGETEIQNVKVKKGENTIFIDTLLEDIAMIRIRKMSSSEYKQELIESSEYY